MAGQEIVGARLVWRGERAAQADEIPVCWCLKKGQARAGSEKKGPQEEDNVHVCLICRAWWAEVCVV